MQQVEIIVGSVLGATEYVADAIAAVCPEIGLIANVHFSPNLADINPDAPWIVCSSTHGAGDLPDNIHAFHKQLQDSTLANPFLVVGLGDSSYDITAKVLKLFMIHCYVLEPMHCKSPIWSMYYITLYLKMW